MSVTVDIHAPLRQELRIAARALDTDAAPVVLEIYGEHGDRVSEVTLFVANKDLAKALAAAINAVMDAYSSDDEPTNKEETEGDSDE